MISVLKNIIGESVKRLFLIVWPPFGEESVSQIDISLGCVFRDKLGRLLIITTDKNDLVTPFIYYRDIPENYFGWKEFIPRMKNWMICTGDMELQEEYYEVSNVELFKNIVGKTVIDVEIVEVSGIGPIGIKIIFEGDYILSTPIIDGNTIETKFFNQYDNLKNFSSLGNLVYRSVNTGTSINSQQATNL